MKMLKKGYKKSEEFYMDFVNDNLLNNDTYIEDKDIEINIDSIPDFPIYLNYSNNSVKETEYFELINAMEKYFFNIDNEYLFDEVFWHSFLCLYKREYLINKYPEILTSQKDFENIVTKYFTWENYIYKAILITQYVCENCDENEKDYYYKLILENFDVFNYILKSKLFKNGNFLINFFKVMNETDTALQLKAKIKNRLDLGKDERFGRRVLMEFSKSYPIVLSPMLSKDQLKEYYLKYLSYYTDDDIPVSSDTSPLEDMQVSDDFEIPEEIIEEFLSDQKNTKPNAKSSYKYKSIKDFFKNSK